MGTSRLQPFFSRPVVTGLKSQSASKDPSSDAGSTFTAHCTLFLGPRAHSKGSEAENNICPSPLRPVFQKILNDSAGRLHLCETGKAEARWTPRCAASVILLPGRGRQGV